MEESPIEYLARIVQATHNMQAEMAAMMLDIGEMASRIERDQAQLANLQFVFSATLVDALHTKDAIDPARISAALHAILAETEDTEALHPLAAQITALILHLDAAKDSPPG